MSSEMSGFEVGKELYFSPQVVAEVTAQLEKFEAGASNGERALVSLFDAVES